MLRNHLFSVMAGCACTFFCMATPSHADLRADATSSSKPATNRMVPIPQRQITQAIDPSQLSPMPTGVRAEANAANDRGLVDDGLQLDNLLMVLHRPDISEQALDDYMAEQLDPDSPNYHQWLTAEQVGEYGPAADDIDAVGSWLQSQGFTINQVSADGMTIDFSGTAGYVKNAFHTEVHQLSVNGDTHIANISQPQIPSALAPVVVGIVSINDFRPNTQARKRQMPAYTYTSGSNQEYKLVPADLATIYNLNPLFSAGIDGTGQTIVLIEDSDVYSTADISTFRSTFGLPANTFATVHPNCTDPGDPDNGTDFEVELDIEYAGAAAPGANLKLASCADTSTFGGLIAMQNLNTANDAARLWSISYGYCEAGNGQSNNAAYSSTYQTAAARGVSVFVAAGDEGAASCDANMQQATHGVGVSGFASTPYNVAVGGTDFGDTFAKTSSTYWNPSNTSAYGSARTYINEIPWNNSCASQLFATYFDGTSGGGNGTTYGTNGFCNSTIGKSSSGTVPLFLTTASGSGGPSGCATGSPSTSGVVSGTCAGTAKPSWQSIVGNPNDGVRDIPDVSLFSANGAWGHYWIVCYSRTDQDGAACTGSPSGWGGGGGTSFASPIMAGIQALINQKAASSQGNPNPTYYKLASAEYGTSGNSACNSTLGNAVGASCAFYDVTQGDIDVNCTGSQNCFMGSQAGTNGVLSNSTTTYSPTYGTTTSAFSGGAAKGWDFATGIGSLNACNLVNSWPGVTNPVTCNPKLAFTVQPNTSYSGNAAISVAVSIEDASGNVMTNANSAVMLALSGGAAGAALNGTTTMNAVNGVATFSNLAVDKAGSAYSLVATDGALTSGPLTNASSRTFNITTGGAAKLVIIQQPTNSVAGATIAPSVKVQVEDAAGNLASSSTASVTLGFANNPGSGTLSGVTTVNAVGGVATFNGLSINKTGNGYTLTASSSTLTSATSSAFDVTPGAATQLVFTQQPTDAPVAKSITPSITASVEDANGNVVTSDTSAVTIAIGNNPGGGALSGTKTVNAISGLATFANLSINMPAVGYTLTISDGALTGATSSPFNETQSPVKLSFEQQPGNSVAGAALSPAVTVQIVDADGNLVSTGDAQVTIAIASNSGASSLGGTLTVNASGGIATFSDLTLNKVGTGYTLAATSTALTTATSNSFDVTAGAPANLVFTMQPSDVLQGGTLAEIGIMEVDANGNVVPDTASVDFTASACGTPINLGSAAMNAGVATLSSALRFYSLASGNQITVSAGGLSALSAGFNVVANAEYIFADRFDGCGL